MILVQHQLFHMVRTVSFIAFIKGFELGMREVDYKSYSEGENHTIRVIISCRGV